MARILVIERRENLRASVLFAAEGHVVVTAVEAVEAVEAIAGLRPELVLVETMVPDTKVVEICRLVRATTAAPIVVLSNPCSERESLAAFEHGADTVISEPVGPHELVARVRALLRRRPWEPELASDVVVVGPISLDRGRREIKVRGELLRVPRREFEIAEILLASAGRTVPRSMIVRELWGTMRDTKSLDVQVGRLRGRLAAAGVPNAIVTVRGVGFRVLAEEELEDLAAAAAASTIDLAEIDLAGAVEIDARDDAQTPSGRSPAGSPA
jgi:DNA-binding response OmpR family regulator